MLQEFIHNLTHNLFKPLLLFFYAGFLIPIFRVKFEFPKAVYQGLTIYLLLAIGWHGGEELASLKPSDLGPALGFMAVGFLTNTCIGIVAYVALRSITRLRRIDAATVAGYYGSDSAGTFVTAMGVLASLNVAYAAYMPVMLAVMEIPGCLVALYLISRLRSNGMDAAGYMPDEIGFDETAVGPAHLGDHTDYEHEEEEELVGAAAGSGHASAHGRHGAAAHVPQHRTVGNGHSDPVARHRAEDFEATMALEPTDDEGSALTSGKKRRIFSGELLHEVFFNPGIFLLFAGISIGFIARLQGESVTKADDPLFIDLFQGVLCMFLLEMGMTASSKLRDLRTAGWQFVVFGLLAPNVFACVGMSVAHVYSMALGQPLEVGTYVLFAVLCAAASYIAVPAVQRMAIPEASPTLPLAASLGLTFSYNVTIGIPVYLMVAQMITKNFPVGG